MNDLEKLLKAKELIMEVEINLIKTKGFCPYEVGFTLRKLDEAIAMIEKSE